MSEEAAILYGIIPPLVILSGAITWDRVKAWLDGKKVKRDTINSIITELTDNKEELQKQNYTLKVEGGLPKADIYFFGVTAFASAVSAGSLYRLNSESQIKLSHMYELARLANLRCQVLLENVINFAPIDDNKQKAMQNYLDKVKELHERIQRDVDDVITLLREQL